MRFLRSVRGAGLARRQVALLLAIVSSVCVLTISESSYQHSSSTVAELVQMDSARLRLYSVMARSADAESAQRGYLLTGRREYLAPYDEAYEDLSRALGDLGSYLAPKHDAAARQLHTQLEQAVGAKLGELDEEINRQLAGRSASALELIKSGIGLEQMGLIRSRTQQLLHTEEARAEAGRQQVLDALMFNRLGVAVMTVASLLALAMYLRASRALVAERNQLELEVQRRTEELTELAAHLETAREDERQRLARELHDELGALLTLARLDVARIDARLEQADTELAGLLSHLNEMLISGLALKRRLIEDLRPSALSTLGLLPALNFLAAEFGKSVGLTVHSRLQAVRLSARAELTVYRMVQEALTNIAKHARSSMVELRLREEAGRVLVEVSDNGCGFNMKLRPMSSHGLLGMRYRVQSEGGEFSMRSAPGRGTAVSASLPALAAT